MEDSIDTNYLSIDTHIHIFQEVSLCLKLETAIVEWYMQKVKECNVFRVLLKRYLHLLIYITVLILNTYLYIGRKSFYKHLRHWNHIRFL